MSETKTKSKKTVRVTIELPASFVGLLSAKAYMSDWKRKALGECHGQIDSGDIVAFLVMMEACGATEEEIHALTPMMWRDCEGPLLIHEERRVYENGVLIKTG